MSLFSKLILSNLIVASTNCKIITSTSLQRVSAQSIMADSAIDNMKFGKDIPRVSETETICNVKRYINLGIAVSDFETSKLFYYKVGFECVSNQPSPDVTIMENKGGLQIHLFLCDEGIIDDKNLLMDFPTEKYPGHTHASVFVPNVNAAKKYFENVADIKLSGERKHNDILKSFFARDPDRTTWEFERNFGNEEQIECVTANMIGFPQPIDHIGIRVSHPPENAIQFYAEKLGFNQLVSKYEPNRTDPLKNGPPWITRTETGIDINFIINANINLKGSEQENILIKDRKIRPGIIYATFSVSNVHEAYLKLKNSGVYIIPENSLHESKFSCLTQKIILVPGGSYFMEDEDKNIIRLVEN